MTTNHYPWNVNVLATWLQLELRSHESPQALAIAMQVPFPSLRDWLSSPASSITLAEIHSIAQYQSWNLQQTINWLGLKPAHVESLIAQDSRGERPNWNDAKAR
ncbi:hypothetical protein IQ254_28235 [Nodosilinea sp. LEGE 07088]|uniref:hypothetical protein n=1 Tax=Nodosilinea sp. LEGE 07088 TaxID=2777968 RepID=UPI00187F2D70|nr:hypothetical protein [Nodosilinea sp. LEGE 07088]MBE9141042.1 hypothetical protein [Nodosilinea sp. LEGE 07088]